MVLLIIHILIMALAVYMKKKNYIKSEPVLLIIAGFMPFIGIILIAVSEFNIKEELLGSRIDEVYSSNINYEEIVAIVIYLCILFLYNHRKKRCNKNTKWSFYPSLL